MDGWVKVHRKLLDWEWFRDVNTSHLFLYCLLKANCKPGRFMGVDIKRGQFATSYAKICLETGLSLQQARTAINHLKITGQLTMQQHGKFTVFTVSAYEQYQCDQQADNKQPTQNQQSINKESTTIEEYKNIRIKESKNINNNNNNTVVKRKAFTPPTLEQVKAYVAEKGYNVDAEKFWYYYDSANWIRKGGVKVTKWKSLVATWKNNDYDARPKQQPVKTVNAQKYEQRTNDLDGAFAQFTPEQLKAMAEED